ncbi:MAG: MFS transporter, partial [Solirubrobacteraceae bacterium]
MRLVRGLLLDTAPLRESPAFRRIWIGGGLSSIGGQMTSFAVLLQVFRLTHSSLSVGLVGLAIALPAILLALAGGAIVDATDRRKVVLIATSVQVAVSATLAAQAFVDLGQVWLLYALVAIQSAVAAVNAPARRTFMPTLLRRDQLPAGAALQMVTTHGSLTIGP